MGFNVFGKSGGPMWSGGHVVGTPRALRDAHVQVGEGGVSVCVLLARGLRRAPVRKHLWGSGKWDSMYETKVVVRCGLGVIS